MDNATTANVGQVMVDTTTNHIPTRPSAPQKTSEIFDEWHFFKLVQEHGYWMGSPADNKAIGLASDRHSTADQNHMEDA
jgi:hypothetical protein